MNSIDTATVEKLWTVKETARRTGYSAWFIYREIADGRLTCVRAGKNRRSIRIAPSDIAQYMAEGKATTPLAERAWRSPSTSEENGDE